MKIRTVAPCHECGYLIELSEKLIEENSNTENNFIDMKIYCPICKKYTFTRIKNEFNII